MRKKVIAGNWKMNMLIEEGIKLAKDIKDNNESNNKDVEIILCPPSTLLKPIGDVIKDSDIKLGAQNVHFEDDGAYTGEISTNMLDDLGVDYVIIGHSERRQYFKETDEIVNKKIKKVLKSGMKAIFCLGESLEQRESDITFDIIKSQVIKGLKDINASDIENIIIAYEPIWAIGTGKTATDQEANEVISFIRSILKELYSDKVSESAIIQYGGSVKPDNANSLLNQSDIDGALVGGASLKANDFLGIINYNK